MGSVPSSHGPQGLNLIYSYLDISTNEPILKGTEQPELIDAKDDLLAPFKVHKYSRRLWAALLAEFLGLSIFQVYGGSANDDVAALANGITLAVIVYATCNVSGGHLNPAVSFANCLTGHMSWSKGGVYALAQTLGGIFGALVESGLMPGVAPGRGQGPGCFTHLKGVVISKGQLFWWECIMTFVLVSVVYATAVTKPGHGSLAPLAIGFTLYASAAVAGPYTGAALNPARVLGPTLVFNCFWDTAFVYIFGQLLGGFLAAILVLPLYGFGQFGSLFDTRILRWLGLQVPHRFQQLPDFDAARGPAHPVTVQASPPSFASPGGRQEAFELRPQPPQALPLAQRELASASRAYDSPPPGASSVGTPQLPQQTSMHPSKPQVPLRTASDASEFLPKTWQNNPRGP